MSTVPAISDLITDLLGPPNRALSTTREWRYGRRGSLAVRADTGAWFDHEAGEGGGVVGLMRREGGDLGQWRRPGSEVRPRGSAKLASLAKHKEYERDRDAKAELDLAKVRTIWVSARPAASTLAEAYLRSRGITAALPPTIRFRRLWHQPSGRDLPCMVAAVQGADGQLQGIHRIFLRPDGGGKAEIEPAKMMLGPCGGGAVRLAPTGSRLVLCEGIESGLSLMQALPNDTVWAALSAGNLPRLVLPDDVEDVLIFPDGDPVGRTAAAKAAERYTHLGYRVRIASVPEGLDANDLLQGARP